jgi:hypothetical protein
MYHISRRAALVWPALLGLGLASQLLAFESTKVLPKGIRNVKLRTLYTTAKTKTTPEGDIEPLADRLWKPLEFRHVLSGESGLKRKQLEALMLQQGWTRNKSLGDFRAEFDAQINVWAPIFAYGFTDRFTLAVALPVYSSSTDIGVGFTANHGAQDFVTALKSPSMNNTQSAVEASQKLQNAVGRLNDKLVDNGYDTFDKWNSTGIGDTTIAAKYLAYDGSLLKAATSFGIVAPTGETESPDILTDLSFGDGQWDAFAQLIFDQNIFSWMTFNQFYKYTYQAPDRREMRLATNDETIEVGKEDLDFKLGDKIEAGTSLQFEQNSTGLTAGLGLQYFRKYGDRYEVEAIDVKNELQRDTAQQALYWKARLGYTSLPAFRRNEMKVPFVASIEYRKQYESINTPRTDFTQVDVGIFF